MATKRPGRRIWPIVLALAAIAAAAFAFRPETPLSVLAVTVDAGLVEDTVTGSSVGAVEAEQTSTVSAEISGRVSAIHIRQGAAEAGAPVIELDGSDLRAERAQTLREIETAALRVEQAKLRAGKMQAELDRLRGTDESPWRIEALEKDLSVARMETDIASASRKALEATLARVDLRLAKIVIAAPYAGTVTRARVELGENVAPGTPLFTIQSAPPFVVRAPIDEVDVPRIAVGQEARVTFDALRDRSFPGTLVEIRPAASTDQKNNRTVDVKVRAGDLPPTIVTGMSAHIEVVLARRPGVVRVATPHIREDAATKRRYVYVLEGGRAVRRWIRTGIWNWDQTEVLEGLAAGDQVVTRTADPDLGTQLRDGRRVKVEDGR